MAKSKAKLYYTTSEYLPTLPIRSGNIIFVPDDNKVCLDMVDQRFEYRIIKELKTDEERKNMPFPNEGFYYIEDTNMIWRWANNRWGQITSANVEPIIHGDCVDDFPEVGRKNTLYYTDDGIYDWKDQSNKYNLIANANRWDSVH